MSAAYQNEARRKRNKDKVRSEARRERRALERRISELHDIDSAISGWEAGDSLNAFNNLESLLAAFSSLVSRMSREDDDISSEKYDFDLCGLALKILKAVEHTDNFQSHFSKLLPSIGAVICSRSSDTWHRVVRPLLDIFTNKKLDFVHLEGTLKELKTISKYAESSEMAKFTQENLHLLQGFYKLAFHAGDFLLQMDILEIVFICAAGDKRLAEAVLAPADQTIRQLLETLNFLDFEKDSRSFLNALNASLATDKRVFSITCNLVYLGNLPLEPPHGMDEIWVDFNSDGRRVTIFCSDFLSNSGRGRRIMLRLPLRRIKKIKVKLSGECYCITIRTISLTEIYEFAKGRRIVCSAPCTKNPRDAVSDFARAVEELSAEIGERPQEGNKFPPHLQPEKTGHCDVDKCQAEKRKPSYTSPAVFTTCKENAEKRTREWNHMSRTSPLILPTESKEREKTQPDKTERDEASVKSTSHVKNIYFQDHQFSNSALQMPSSPPSNDTNDRNERSVELKGDELSNQSTAKIEGQRLPHAMLCESEEARHARGRKTESPEECIWGRDLTTIARICEDFNVTDEYAKNSVETEAPKEDAENTSPTEGRAEGNEEKARRKSIFSTEKKGSGAEEIRKTSLLNPNGYAYRRWLRPTTSERSNFWLKKLRDRHIPASEPETDTSQSTEEERLSDDSEVFSKDVAVKGRKPGPASGRERRRQKDRKKRAETTEVGRPNETRTTGSKLEKRVNSKKAGELQSNGRIRKGAHKRAVAPRGRVPGEFRFETDASTFSEGLPLHDKSEEGQKSGGGGAQTATKRSGKNQCCPATPEVQNEEAPKARCPKVLDGIAKSLSSGFEKLMQKIGEKEAARARKYAEEIGRMKALTEEEEEEMAYRSLRFELWIQYFFAGCSAVNSNGYWQAEMEKIVDGVSNLNREEKYRKKVSAFVGKLRKKVAEEAEAALNKHVNIAHIRCLQNLLLHSFGKGFLSHANIYSDLS